MKAKKLMSTLLAACLLVSSLPAALAADAKPDVVLEISKITADQTVEVGLNVTAAGFKSVGAILEVDSTKLQLAEWDGAVKNAVTVDGTSWSNYNIVPSKGVDIAGAKPALAYQDAASNKQIVYFGADAFDTITVTNQRMVTLRFKVVYTAADGADDATKAAAEKAAFEALNEDALKSAIQISSEPANIINMVGGGVQVICGSGASAAYYRYNPVKMVDSAPSIDEDYNVDLKLSGTEVTDTVVMDGTSVGTTESEGASYGVTFLDWDGTVLETVAIAKKSDVSALIGYDAAKKDDDASNNGWGSAIDSTLKAALTGKRGYAFDCWLDYSTLDANAPFTSTSAEAGIDQTAQEKYVVDLTSFDTEVGENRTGITLQAAYKNDGTLVLATQAGGNYVMGNEPYYIRYGAATENEGKYGVRLTAQRNGTERIRDMGVVVAMTPAGASQAIFSFQRMTSSETADFEIVPTKEIAKVVYSVVEVYGVASWANGGARSGAYREIAMADVIKYGSANYLMEQAILKNAEKPGEWDVFVDLMTFTDAGINATDLDAAKQAVLTGMAGKTAPVSYEAFTAFFTANT